MRILISVPHLDKHGGVSNFYRSLKPLFPENVDFIIRGSALNSNTKLSKIKDNLASYYNFYRLNLSDYDVFNLNLSFDKVSLKREYRYIKLMPNYKGKVIVYFRGWDARKQDQVYHSCKKEIDVILKRADAVITLSEASKNYIKNLGFNGPVYLETTTVDDQLLNGLDIVKLRQDRKKKIKEGNLNPVLLFLARTTREKGIFETLQAYKIALKDYPNLKLRIAGDGADLDEAKSLCIDEKLVVDFPGYLRGQHKTRAYLESDIYIFPSYTEGMPNSVLEAMMFGLPIITRPVGGLTDIIRNGVNGYISDTLDPRIFANQICYILANKENSLDMSKKNFEMATDMFSSKKVVGRLMQIYSEVIAS